MEAKEIIALVMAMATIILGGVKLLLMGFERRQSAAFDDLWKRANTHGHTIECDSTGCKPKTTAVILHEGN